MCPLCDNKFPSDSIDQHVNDCLDKSLKRASEDVIEVESKRQRPGTPEDSKIHLIEDDDDEALARQLQAEEDASAASWNCPLCQKPTSIDAMYILDVLTHRLTPSQDCNHRFCRACLSKHALKAVASGVTIPCPTQVPSSLALKN